MAKLAYLESRPDCYLKDTKNGVWPDDPLADDAPPEALLALHISMVLRDTCKSLGLTTRDVEERTDLSQGAVQHLIRGSSWPVLGVIANIERKLGIQLWASQHNLGYGDDTLELRPNVYLDRGTWPTGPLVDDAPTEAKLAKHIAWLLRSHIETEHLTPSDVSETVGISEAAVHNLLNGDSWPDLSTIHRVERGLDATLWIRRL